MPSTPAGAQHVAAHHLDWDAPAASAGLRARLRRRARKPGRLPASSHRQPREHHRHYLADGGTALLYNDAVASSSTQPACRAARRGAGRQWPGRRGPAAQRLARAARGPARATGRGQAVGGPGITRTAPAAMIGQRDSVMVARPIRPLRGANQRGAKLDFGFSLDATRRRAPHRPWLPPPATTALAATAALLGHNVALQAASAGGGRATHLRDRQLSPRRSSLKIVRSQSRLTIASTMDPNGKTQPMSKRAGTLRLHPAAGRVDARHPIWSIGWTWVAEPRLRAAPSVSSYVPGGHYQLHTDSSMQVGRIASAILFLEEPIAGVRWSSVGAAGCAGARARATGSGRRA